MKIGYVFFITVEIYYLTDKVCYLIYVNDFNFGNQVYKMTVYNLL